MSRSRLIALLLVCAGCPRPPIMIDEDAGEPIEPVYDGPTQNAGIPDLPEGFRLDASIPLIDSGVIMVDTRCCSTNFSIADQEPASATGVLRIELGAFSSGVALARSAGRWSANACFPVNQSAPYQYEFTWDAGIVDAGLVGLDDGGIVGLEFTDIRVIRRASEDEPSYALVDGTRANFFRSVSSCDGLDGSVPP